MPINGSTRNRWRTCPFYVPPCAKARDVGFAALASLRHFHSPLLFPAAPPKPALLRCAHQRTTLGVLPLVQVLGTEACRGAVHTSAATLMYVAEVWRKLEALWAEVGLKAVLKPVDTMWAASECSQHTIKPAYAWLPRWGSFNPVGGLWAPHH